MIFDIIPLARSLPGIKDLPGIVSMYVSWKIWLPLLMALFLIWYLALRWKWKYALALQPLGSGLSVDYLKISRASTMKTFHWCGTTAVVLISLSLLCSGACWLAAPKQLDEAFGYFFLNSNNNLLEAAKIGEADLSKFRTLENKPATPHNSAVVQTKALDLKDRTGAFYSAPFVLEHSMGDAPYALVVFAVLFAICAVIYFVFLMLIDAFQDRIPRSR